MVKANNQGADFKLVKINFQFQELNFEEPSRSFHTHVSSEVSLEEGLECTPKSISHHLFLKQNSSKNQGDLPNEKTLFLLNVPCDTTDKILENVFKSYGTVQLVKWRKSTAATSGFGVLPGSSCHVVFKDEESVQEILKIKKLEWPMDVKNMGLQKYLSQNVAKKQEIESLQASVDAAMELFESEERKAREERERMRNVPDEDGFVTVVRSGKKTNNDGQGGSVLALKREDAEKLKPKEKKLLDFYRFQIRERKRDELAELRKKFEQDKTKIQAMKESRKFKPY